MGDPEGRVDVWCMDLVFPIKNGDIPATTMCDRLPELIKIQGRDGDWKTVLRSKSMEIWLEHKDHNA